MFILLSGCQNSQDTLFQYFVNADYKKVNVKDFYLTTDFNDKIIFKQVVQNEVDKPTISIEYQYMTKDSVPYLSGVEVLDGNILNFSEQYIYVNGRKIPSQTVGDKTWNIFEEPEKKIKLKFVDEKTNISFESQSNAHARLVDTLDTKMFVIKYETVTTYFKNGLKLKDEPSKSVKYYEKNKGLVYFSDTYNNTNKSYTLKQ